jgi:aminomuconate-semialdehyde/2-hydroxymuconate-6-semialdehyde dehydrogenase
MIHLSNYIGGEHCPPQKGQYLPNIAPATAEVFSYIPDSDAQDVAQAVAAAQEAFPLWSGLSAEERSKILMRVAAGIEAQLEALAEAESLDNGKPIQLARQMDIPRAAQNFHFFATGILHFASEAHPMPGQAVINYTLRQPLGIVGCISPWNLPLYLFTWKIAPALAAGNCVVAKPSEVTPYTAHLLAQICMDAGMPPGVLNIVHGTGPRVGEAIVKHPNIKAISFTGGTSTGAQIASLAAPMFKKLSLELGGKNPNLIFADCEYDKMLQTTLRSSFANQGQICLCGSRIYVERSIYERFKTDFVAAVKALRLGPPSDPQTQVGAVVSAAHRDKILSYIELAKAEGGTILCGGHGVELPAPYDKGYFIAPTVIEGLDHQCRTNQEEIFGPVVTLQPFDTEMQALEYANSVRYGLAATVWTQNLNRALRLGEQLQSGIVWVNCWLLRDLRTPFGGVKDSGIGREGGWDALRFFSETKNVCLKY